MNPAIELEGVEKVYPGGVRALGGVTLSVGTGEIFGFLGRNGAGKTTTVRILATLTRATAGIARVAGHRVDRDPQRVRTCIGLTMQDAALDDLMTAREHLELVGRLHGMSGSGARSRATGLLAAFGLGDAAERVVATFSGGMGRRLDIAMALVHAPAVLFLDEPTAGLDPQSRRATWTLIRDLRAAGTTVLLTTQYLEEADELADRVAVIDAGRVVAEGTPRELKASLGRTTVTVRVSDHAEADRLRRALPHAVVLGDGSSVRIEIGQDSRRVLDVLGRIRTVGTRIDGVSVSEPSLEDVFVRLTGDRLDVSTGSDSALDVAIARRFRGSPAGARR